MLKLCDTLDFMLYDSSHHIYCTLPPWDDPARNLFSRHNLWCWGLIREKRKSRYVYSLPAHILSPPTPQHIDQLTRNGARDLNDKRKVFPDERIPLVQFPSHSFSRWFLRRLIFPWRPQNIPLYSTETGDDVPLILNLIARPIYSFYLARVQFISFNMNDLLFIVLKDMRACLVFLSQSLYFATYVHNV